MGHLHHSHRGRRGSILYLAAVLIAVIGAMTLSLLTGTVRAVESTSLSVDSLRAQAVADSASALAAQNLWTTFEREFGAGPARPWDFQDWLDARGIPDQAGEANPVGLDVAAWLGLPRVGDVPMMDGVAIERLELIRRDTWNQTRLEVIANARASSGAGGLASTRQVFEIGASDWEGLDYAILANNVNCILCHAGVDDVQRAYATDPTLAGTFQRVRIGSLESITFRHDPDSWIAGTLYVGGQARFADSAPVTDWSSVALESRRFDSTGYLEPDPWGALVSTALDPVDPAFAAPFGNLYLDYLAGGPDAQIDGSMPASFPAPFPDDGGYDFLAGAPTPELGGNRVVDENEFRATVANFSGTISGGAIGVSPVGAIVSDSGDLNALLVGNTAGISAVLEGNVVLYGTPENPIRIDGDVAIQGDVILIGVVEGAGTIMASGNVYVPSDLLYADATGEDVRTFGTAVDGSTNLLAVAAGGNVILGDPRHPRWGAGSPADGVPGTSFNFVMDGVANFNQMEWLKTQPTLPGLPAQVVVGTRTWQQEIFETRQETYTVSVPILEWQETGRMISQPIYENRTTTNGQLPPYLVETTTRVIVGYRDVPERIRVQVGTREETRTRTVRTGNSTFEERSEPIYEWQTPQYPNPDYAGPGFVPRYYAFAPGAPVPIFNKDGHFDPVTGTWRCDEMAGGWDETKLTLADPSDANDPLLYDAEGKPIAVISTVLPSDGWLAAAVLSGLVEDLYRRRDANAPVEVNAVLYSNNSIFGLVPGRNTDGVDGRLTINGSLVAADIGVLAPKGLEVRYDRRGRDVLQLVDSEKLEMRRALWAPAAARP